MAVKYSISLFAKQREIMILYFACFAASSQILDQSQK